MGSKSKSKVNVVSCHVASTFSGLPLSGSEALNSCGMLGYVCGILSRGRPLGSHSFGCESWVAFRVICGQNVGNVEKACFHSARVKVFSWIRHFRRPLFRFDPQLS